jgi:hypothetical protein
MALGLTDEQFNWINSLAKAAGVKGLPGGDVDIIDDDDVEVEEYGEAYGNLDARGAPTDLVAGTMPDAHQGR